MNKRKRYSISFEVPASLEVDLREISERQNEIRHLQAQVRVLKRKFEFALLKAQETSVRFHT